MKTVINSKSTSLIYSLRELWKYKYVILEFTKKDIKIKYTQTYLGVIWAVINPLFSILVLSFVFSKIGNVKSENVPNVLFTGIGYLAWQYFSTTITECSKSFIQQMNLLKKTYVPKLILPLSKAVSSSLEIIIGLFIIVGLIIYFGQPIYLNLPKLILVLFGIFMMGLGSGILISSVSLRYRDFHHIVPLVLRIMIFLSPISYALSDVPDKYHYLIKLNPLSGFIDHTRACFIEGYIPQFGLTFSFVVTILILVTSLLYFNKIQRVIADII
jgi:lipopolysaccharide transport system permease protein